jgi:2-oxoglutarate ferredoxin oxidoreductase subunit alpha
VSNADTIKPGVAAEGIGLCPLPVSKLADISRNKVAQNTLAVGAGLSMMGIGFQALEEVLSEQFKKKGDAVVFENVGIARAGYDYANANFRPPGRAYVLGESSLKCVRRDNFSRNLFEDVSARRAL